MNRSGFVFFKPNKRGTSYRSVMTTTKTTMSFNEKAMNEFFNVKDNVKTHVEVGYDKKQKLLLIIPTINGGLKLYKMRGSKRFLINTKKLNEELSLDVGNKTEYKCSWNKELNGILINLEIDRIRVY